MSFIHHSYCANCTNSRMEYVCVLHLRLVKTLRADAAYTVISHQLSTVDDRARGVTPEPTLHIFPAEGPRRPTVNHLEAN